MAFELSRVDRLIRTYDLATIPLGGDGAATPSAVLVALLPPRSGPSAATVWTSVTYAAGIVTVLLAGPDADPTGAVVVPASADLWMKVVDTPEIDAVKVERITVLGGGPLSISPAQAGDAAIAALLNDTGSATYAKVVALIAARAGFGNGTP